ncbi:MAG TPA: TetR family transcriptional regulator [Burkholderiales bacterium]|nr:TetR family transcriptional regulator [Burkholderiales bacterium]
MPRHTKDEALETRNALLDAAERVFSKRGVSRTSLADIAAAAGVTRGAIYWHFADKADLFWAMLSRVRLPLELEAEPGSPQADPVTLLKLRMLRALLAVALQPQAQRVIDIVCHKCEFVEDMTALRRRYLTMRGNCIGQIESEVAQGVREKLLRADIDPHLAAVGLHALLDGLISNWLVGRDKGFFPLARDAEQLVDLFIDGMRAKPAARRPRNNDGRPRHLPVPGRRPGPRQQAGSPKIR